MNIIIDRPQLVRVFNLYLDKTIENSFFYGDENIFMVVSGDKTLFNYYKSTGELEVNYELIFDKLTSIFSISWSDCENLILNWAVKKYNIPKTVSVEPSNLF
jgi:hypothetical protein